MTKLSLPSPEPFVGDDVIFPGIEPNRKQVCQWLACKPITLWKDIKLLQKACPDEFIYYNNQETFDQSQCKALWKVRCLCVNHKNRAKVLRILKEGL